MGCAQSQGGSSFGTYILKSCVAQILKETVRLPVLLLRVHVRVFADVRVGAEKILVAVVVEIIDPCTPPAHLEAGESNAGFIGSHREKFSVLVAKEGKRFSAKRRYEKARSPVESRIGFASFKMSGWG